jgi:hypothetical protein
LRWAPIQGAASHLSGEVVNRFSGFLISHTRLLPVKGDSSARRPSNSN